MKKIVAVIPVRAGSQRVPNKNFKLFFNNKNLLEHKIEVLKKVESLDEIIVHSDSKLAEEIAKKYKVTFQKREDYFASSECPGSDFFENLASTINADIIVHAPCTSPLVSAKTYTSMINQFSLTSEHDSVNTVADVKEFMWLDNKPLNYNPSTAPNSQDLPDVLKLTFGCNVLSKLTMLENKHVVGKNPSFYTVDEIEAVDIDTPLDFKLAQLILNQDNGYI